MPHLHVLVRCLFRSFYTTRLRSVPPRLRILPLVGLHSTIAYHICLPPCIISSMSLGSHSYICCTVSVILHPSIHLDIPDSLALLLFTFATHTNHVQHLVILALIHATTANPLSKVSDTSRTSRMDTAMRSGSAEELETRAGACIAA